MLGFGYVVCAVVKAGYGDCIARNLDIAGEVFPVAKCLAIAVIVCGVDFNVCDICRSNEVRRDIIRQDSGAAKINAGLADGFAKLSKYAAERVCIACDFVEAFCYVSGAGVLHAACFRIVGRDKVHVAIGSSVVVIGRKRLTYACPIENTNGIYRCAVGLILESFCLIYCSLCYSSIKAVVVIRFTIGKHNHNTIAVFRHLASSTKYIDCFFKAVVSRCCAAGCESVYRSLQRCCTICISLCQILHYLSVVIGIPALFICIIADRVFFIAGKLYDSNFTCGVILGNNINKRIDGRFKSGNFCIAAKELHMVRSYIFGRGHGSVLFSRNMTKEPRTAVGKFFAFGAPAYSSVASICILDVISII